VQRCAAVLRLTRGSLSSGGTAGYRRHTQFISDHRSVRTFRAFGLPADASKSKFNDEPLWIVDIRLPKKMTLLWRAVFACSRCQNRVFDLNQIQSRRPQSNVSVVSRCTRRGRRVVSNRRKAMRCAVCRERGVQLGRASREDIKTTGRVLHHHFVYFMCLRLLGPKYAPDVGGRCHRAAACFLFADGCDILTIRLDAKN
jgi:hypothetical protein